MDILLLAKIKSALLSYVPAKTAAISMAISMNPAYFMVPVQFLGNWLKPYARRFICDLFSDYVALTQEWDYQYQEILGYDPSKTTHRLGSHSGPCACMQGLHGHG